MIERAKSRLRAAIIILPIFFAAQYISTHYFRFDLVEMLDRVPRKAPIVVFLVAILMVPYSIYLRIRTAHKEAEAERQHPDDADRNLDLPPLQRPVDPRIGG